MQELEIWESMEQNASRCREAWSHAGAAWTADDRDEAQGTGASRPHAPEAMRAVGALELPVEWIV